MKTRTTYEPDRQIGVGYPLNPWEDLEVDRTDPLRPVFVWCDRRIDKLKLGEISIEVQFNDKSMSLLGFDDQVLPWTVAIVTDDELIDVRSVESESVRRRFVGSTGSHLMVRDKQGVGWTELQDGVHMLDVDEPDNVWALALWDSRALNKAELEDILASPGGFFRHIRLKQPQIIGGATVARSSTGSTTGGP